jgi:acetoin utilization protein AcuB
MADLVHGAPSGAGISPEIRQCPWTEVLMRIFEVMTPAVHTVAPSCAAEEAWQMMHGRGVRHLIVKDGSRVVGVVSEADLGGRSGAAVRRGAIVADLMEPHVTSVTRQDTIRKAANLMRGRIVGCLPVIEDDHLIGIVTVADLLAVLGRGVDRPIQPPRKAPHFKVAHRRAVAATGRW